MVDYYSLEPKELEQFLLRRRAGSLLPNELSLAENLVEILRKANEFVPSAAGSILLDDPTRKSSDRRDNALFFIAVFGEAAGSLIGASIPADSGIAGHVYVSGRSYYSADVSRDRHFYSGVDEVTRYHTQSLVAIPIRIEREVCGVLELLNRQGATDYDSRDLNLLEVFAGYISVSIQNVLDARQSQEIARRDNLTGLFNDRYLHIGLTRAIEASRSRDQDLAVLFMDLDFFKRVNDTHGHLAGSQVLRELGHLLQSLIPDAEAVVARYGGDEFVLAVPGVTLSEAVGLAESIRGRISLHTFCERPGDIDPRPLGLQGITASVGVATLRQHLEPDLSVAEAKSTLLRLSDTAMYIAKAAGRNRTEVAPRESPEEVLDLGRRFRSVE
jgi:diguanylate cyclase (GGDEF)-like protein